MSDGKGKYENLEHPGFPCVKCGIGCCVVFLFIIFIGLPIFVAHKATERHFNWAENTYANCPGYPEKYCTQGDLLTPKNYTRYVAWNGCKQGYKTDKDLSCLTPCMAPSTIALVDKYNSDNPFKLVGFPSRKGPDGQKVAQLKAWWLPSGSPDAPRVVLLHGNNANANSRMQIMAAYLLRSMKIDVLVPNLRSHGLSQEGFDKTTWSYEYPFDLLGAWDYAVGDPDGELGGKRPASQVGVMGFSMGGYVATSAFGLEKAIPALWADGAVFTVKGQTVAGIGGLPLVGLLAPVLTPIAMAFTRVLAGVDVDKYSPPLVLPGGPKTKRKIAIVGSSFDTFVPPTESLRLEHFVESYKAEYEVILTWFPKAACNDNNHCPDEFLLTDEYRAKLFSFWNKAFGNTLNQTSFESLPSLSKHKEASLEQRRLQTAPSSTAESTWLV